MTTRVKQTVLVIEDERGPRESLSVLLRPRYRVLSAGSAAAALDMLDLAQVDLVTLDLQLPDSRDLDLLKTIRNHGYAVPIIIVTGYGTVSSAAEAFRCGVTGYLLKPYNPHELFTVVQQVLAKADLLQLQLPFG